MIKLIQENKWYFFIIFLIILISTFFVLYFFDLVPKELKSIIGRELVQEFKNNQIGEIPLNIKIPIINIDSQIYNPETTNIKVLDDYLSKGAVRYPSSGLLGGNRNIFIFGHSTGIKFVNNQAYKTFNGLENLKKDDEIFVFSEKYKYIYKVSSVKTVNADKELIKFNKNKTLTISTCDNFSEKSNRYVVEAEFVFRAKI
ncbi:MAG: sortase [bacterium]